MKGCRKRGFTGAIWCLGGDPFSFPGSLQVWGQMGTIDGKMTRAAWDKAQMGQGHVLPETRARFIEWMRTLNAHAVDNGCTSLGGRLNWRPP